MAHDIAKFFTYPVAHRNRKPKTENRKPILCEGALRHRNTRELYSNNLRAVGPKHAQLKTKQNRKQDNKTRHRDQNKVNK